MSCNDTSSEGWATYNMCACGGDPGEGIYFIKKWDPTTETYYAAIAGVHTASRDGTSRGPKAETIYNEYGYYWT